MMCKDFSCYGITPNDHDWLWSWLLVLLLAYRYWFFIIILVGIVFAVYLSGVWLMAAVGYS